MRTRRSRRQLRRPQKNPVTSCFAFETFVFAFRRQQKIASPKARDSKQDRKLLPAFIFSQVLAVTMDVPLVRPLVLAILTNIAIVAAQVFAIAVNVRTVMINVSLIVPD